MAIYGTLGGQDSTTTGYPSIRPTLDLNFAQTKVLDPRVTFYRDSLGTYVDSLGIIRTVPANVPRFDHDPTTGESLGLLIEESRINYYSYSETFAGIWTNDGIAAMTSNQAIAPDGNNTASKIVGPYIYRYFTYSGAPITNGSTVTVSVFVKNNGANTFNFAIYSLGGTTVTASVNLLSGTITGTGASIQSYPNGWYRIILTRTIDTGSGYASIEGLGGSGSSQSIYVWGAQVEVGAFPTSYIPTTATTVTRSADTAYMDGTNFSNWYNSAEGSFFIDTEYRGNSSVLFELQPIGSSRTVLGSIGNNIAMINKNGGVLLTSNNPIVGGNYNKIAITDKISDGVLIVNGQVIGTSNGTGIPSYTSLVIGNSAFSERMTGHIKRFMYYPKRLTNAQLQNLTAL